MSTKADIEKAVEFYVTTIKDSAAPTVTDALLLGLITMVAEVAIQLTEMNEGRGKLVRR